MRLLQTTAHPCGYWPERLARNVLLDDSSDDAAERFPQLLAAGFRRSGSVIYRPRCDACNACIPVRVPVTAFHPDRGQRRCLTRNADLRITLEPARVDDAVLELYGRYVDSRHPGSGMSTRDPAEFAGMFMADFADTRFVCARDGDRLLSVAVTDVTSVGCSAVYTFFEPDRGDAVRSLGTFGILAQIVLTRELRLPYLYLGYWLDQHPSMGYKQRFRPQQHLTSQGWMDAGSGH